MASAIQFNNNFKNKKKEFDLKYENTTLINEKSDTYDYLLKNKSKNLTKLTKLMQIKDEELSFSNTPLHLLILKTITTVEAFITQISKHGFNFKITYSDKFYLGILSGVICILLLLFKL